MIVSPDLPAHAALCFAIFGDPVGHSKSPRMHNAAFAIEGLPHRYLAFEVQPSDLRCAVDGAFAMGFGGINLTVPHKRAVLPWLAERSPQAQRVGAVNTLIRTEAGWRGHTTDGGGLVAGVASLGLAPRRRAVVLGGGGSALAIVDALLHGDPACAVDWVTRSVDKLPAWSGATPRTYAELSGVLPTADLLVNTTTVGMQGGAEQFPVPVEVERLPPTAVVVDIVYPRPAGGLLDRAQARGLAVQDGLPMLLWQGVLAQEAWRGAAVPSAAIEAMRAALRG